MSSTLSGAMDAPLTALMRAAILLTGPQPDIAAAVSTIVLSAQTLEAVRIGVAHFEGLAIRPTPAAVSPCAVVDLGAFRAARGEPVVPA